MHWDDGFRRWQAVGQSTVWLFVVEVFPALFDQNLRLIAAGEDLTVEQFVPEPLVGARAVSVFPR